MSDELNIAEHLHSVDEPKVCATCERMRLEKERDELRRENSELNKALALKLDAMPSGLSAGQSMKLEADLASTRAELEKVRAACAVKDEAIRRAGGLGDYAGHDHIPVAKLEPVIELADKLDDQILEGSGPRHLSGRLLAELKALRGGK